MTKYPPNILNAKCPSRNLLELIADKWTMLVFSAITRGINRHNALLREIDGISQKMLSQTLKKLERNGFLERVVVSDKPLNVEYHFTELSVPLADLIKSMGVWVRENFEDVQSAQENYDAKQTA